MNTRNRLACVALLAATTGVAHADIAVGGLSRVPVLEMLEAEGLRSIAFETGANRPSEGDYLALMRWNLGNLERLVPVGDPVTQDAEPE